MLTRWITSRRLYSGAPEFSATLNLPQTEFSMRANASQREAGLLNHDGYHFQRNYPSTKNFVLHDGPPYANGNLHMGHAVNKILKDVVCRTRMLEGYRVHYRPGWDCHGLPIEIKALEQHKKSGKTQALTPIELRKLAREYALSQIEHQKREFMKYGVLGDWENYYSTMSPAYEAQQIDVFRKMYNRGLISRGEKPVYWSPSSRTALAEAELEYEDNHVSPSVYVRFRAIRNIPQIIAGYIAGKDLNIIIWTTTPWTIPANRALCMNSQFQYSLMRIENEFVIVATERVESLQEVFQKSFISTGITLNGADFEELMCEHPLTTAPVPVIFGSHVTNDSGTGIVHTAPGHGKEDYHACKEVGISAFSPVDDAGCFTAAAGEGLSGLYVLDEGNAEVIRQLSVKQKLVAEQKYSHRYPYDWRTKKPVIIRSTAQWFADLSIIKGEALEALEDVQFIPDSSRRRLSSFVVGRDDWCISRQRHWGFPIPVFYDQIGQPLITDETLDHIANLFRIHGSDCWWTLDVSEMLPPSLKNRANEFIKGTDTLDVWFDSGSSWKSVLQLEDIDSADVYLEGFDQHRGWFQSSLLTSVSVQKKAPYKLVLSHGFVMDAQGFKMSKSLGNIVLPSTIISGGKIGNETIAALGVDVLRTWIVALDYSADMNLSSKLIADASNTLRKLRNTARFILGNLFDFTVDAFVPVSEMTCTDRYIIDIAREFESAVRQDFNEFNFHGALRKLLNFTSTDLSTFYLDVTKDRLYTSAPASHLRRSAQTSLLLILRAYLAALMPIAPHLAQDILNHVPKSLVQNISDVSFIKWEDFGLAATIPQLHSEVRSWMNLLRDMKTSFNSELLAFKQSHPNVKVSSDVDVEVIVRDPLPSDPAYLLGAEVFIASNVKFVHERTLDAEYRLVISEASVAKCPRCWKKVARNDNPICNKDACPM